MKKWSLNLSRLITSKNAIGFRFYQNNACFIIEKLLALKKPTLYCPKPNEIYSYPFVPCFFSKSSVL